MSIWETAYAAAGSEEGQKALIASGSAAVGWFGSLFSGWWKSRDKYHAYVTWKTLATSRMPEEFPVVVIQSVHSLPIQVTNVRLRNGLRWHTRFWAFNSEDPDYPDLPRSIEPMKETMFVLDEHALQRASNQIGFLHRLWVPRVYVGIQTMGRGERLFVAERGLPYNQRRIRYQR